MQQVTLLMVVEVSPHKRVRCDYKGCNHSVFKRIHIVLFDEGHYECLGSSCYKKLSEQIYIKAQRAESVDYIGQGKLLTDEQREQLIENKALLLENLFIRAVQSDDQLKTQNDERANISQAAVISNYRLLSTYTKFNPDVNYSKFEKGEKYSRAVDMVHRRYRDEGLSLNINSRVYQQEIQALIEDMVDHCL